MKFCFFSERGFLLEFYALTGLWMTELQTFGMEVHAVGSLSVERVTQDGAVHAVRMGGVDTELVGTATFGIVGHAGAKMLLFIDEMGGGTQYLVTGDSVLPVLEIDHLQGAIVVVRTERQTDEIPFILGSNDAVEQGDVALLHFPFLELFLKQGMGLLVLGYQQQARGVHVQTVHHEGTGSIGVAFPHQALDGFLAVLSGYGEHTGRLVDYQ